MSSSDDSIDPYSGVSKSDIIAIQYENQIKELRDICDLLSGIPLPEVVIIKEEQLMAITHLSEVHGSNQRSESMSVDMSEADPQNEAIMEADIEGKF